MSLSERLAAARKEQETLEQLEKLEAVIELASTPEGRERIVQEIRELVGMFARDKLTHDERLRLECIAQANQSIMARPVAAPPPDEGELIRRAQAYERYIRTGRDEPTAEPEAPGSSH